MDQRRPRVFISANSTEFQHYRRVVTEEMLRMECDPIAMDHFSTYSGNLKDLLVEKISKCDAVLCLIGRAFGEPLPLPPGTPPRSYTQYEYDLAQQFGKPTFLLLKDYKEGESHLLEHPDQKRYVEEIKRSGLVWHTFSSEDELRRYVLGINLSTFSSRDIPIFKPSKKSRLPLIASVIAVLLAASGVWYATQKGEPKIRGKKAGQQQVVTEQEPVTEENEVVAEPEEEPKSQAEMLAFSNTHYEKGKPAKIMLAEGVYKDFVWCPPGTFTMGFGIDEAGSKAEDREDAPPQTVTFKDGFWMAAHELTVDELKALEGNVAYPLAKLTSGENTAKGLPVSGITYNTAKQLTEWLNTQQKASLVISLPLECEWEYAARAGSITPFSFGYELDGTQANCDGRAGSFSAYGRESVGKSLNQTVLVGSYAPNKWGLYDMHGNVREWVLDYYSRGYSPVILGQLPTGPVLGTSRVLRGGYWNTLARNCRSASRNRAAPDVSVEGAGIRLVARLKNKY